VDLTALTGLAVAVAVMLAATVLGVWWRRQQGRVRQVSGPPVADPPGAEPTAPHLSALGVEPGPSATLLQFSSAFCAPCRATRLTCQQVADQVAAVRYIEVDAEHRLDQVRALGVWRTPTVFVIDAAGRIVSRITGQPTRAQVMAAVDPLLPEQCGVSGA
jgi:thiol-disulfide isomerase/thioredoxin